VKRQFTQKPEKKTQSGITLIEVLIVVAVILLLMIALYRNLGGDVNKARDAQRKKDLREIKVAMENYYNDHDCYPAADAFSTCDSTNLNPYLKQIPCDPLGQPYLYLPESSASGASGNSCGGYRVLTKMGDDNDPSIAQVGCPTGCGVPDGVTAPSDYNYGVAEGVALDQTATYPVGEEVTPNPTEEPIATPTGTIVDVDTCIVGNECYCCDGEGGNACNVWYDSQGASQCSRGPYENESDCVAWTNCQ